MSKGRESAGNQLLLNKAGSRMTRNLSTSLIFIQTFFYVHLYSSLMRQTPNKAGDSGDAVGEELDALFQAVSLWSVVPAAIPCALMILADDTVLNIGASSSRDTW